LEKHREGLDRVAEELVEKEEITGKEVLELVGAEKSKPSLNRGETLESPPVPSIPG
jgi:hypothetical protein